MSAKWPIALLGTIILGAIGSGLWDILFKPSFSWLAEALLNIATLGLATIRDQMYAEIAKGTYERAAVSILALLSGITMGLFLSLALFLMLAAGLSGIDRSLTAFAGRRPRNIAFFLALFFGLSAGFVFFNAVRMVYIVRAANHIEQLQRVVAPFVDQEQRLLFASRVAQISSRNDYEKIIDDLSSIARKNSAQIPTFDMY